MSQAHKDSARIRGHVGQAAAWLAIVAAALAVIALLLLVFRNFLTLLVVLVALGIAGASGWTALTHHSWVRLLAVAVFVVALGGSAAALITRGAVDELIAFSVALAACGISTSTAIRQSTVGRRLSQGLSVAEIQEDSHRTRPVLLMNPKSGGGKVEKYDLVNEAKRRGVKPVLLGPDDDLHALAHDLVRSVDVMGMAGGDGSQALVAQAAMEAGVSYVCVPAGTRNHFALDLGLDRDDVVGALDAFTSDIERRIDLAFVNDRIFVNNVSLGIYAQIVASEDYRDAKLQTAEKMLPELLGPDARRFDLRYRDPGGGGNESAQLILVSNNPYQLDRLAGIGSRPSLDTGRLGIVTVEIENAAQAAELVSLEALGQVRRFRGWREWSATEFEVDSSAPVATGIDGEAIMLDPPLRFRIAPASLRVRLPPSAVGLSPAALKPGLTMSTLGTLWRIAIGRA